MLDEWTEGMMLTRAPAATQLHHQTLNLYMHEIALHVDHNVDEFRPPYPDEHLKEHREPPQPDMLTPSHISALTTCLSAIQSVIGIFLSYDCETVRVLPIFHFVRVAYAVVCLTKMYFAVTSPNSELGRVISRESLKVEHTLDGLLESFRVAAEGEKCRPASKFLMILVMLKTWFQKQKGGTPKDPALGRTAHAGGRSLSPNGVEDHCPLRRALYEMKYERGAPDTPRSGAGYPPCSSQSEEPMRGDCCGHATQRHENHQAPSGYSTANTPLQLLSEVAMGDSTGLDGHASASIAAGRLGNGPRPPSTGAGWYGFNPPDATSTQSTIDYSQPDDLNPSHVGYGAPTDAEIEAAMGDGFGQALGMTLGDGFGQALALGDDEWSSMWLM